MTGQIKRSNEDCDTTKKLLLAAESQVRQLEESVTWSKKSVEEAVATRIGLEKAMAEKVLAAKKDREEMETLRKDLQDAESQRRRDGDETVRLTHLLTDATTAKNSGDKAILELEVQIKRLREDVERGRRYPHLTPPHTTPFHPTPYSTPSHPIPSHTLDTRIAHFFVITIPGLSSRHFYILPSVDDFIKSYIPSYTLLPCPHILLPFLPTPILFVYRTSRLIEELTLAEVQAKA